MIVDRLTNIHRYPQLAQLEPCITAFLSRLEGEGLGEGRYELIEGKVYALVQRYLTHEKQTARMESHRKYADLQYICEGEEIIFYDIMEELEVEEGYNLETDIAFYRSRPDLGGICLKAGMFGYYEPQDAHMPGITGKEQSGVTKVVFKISV